MFPNAWNSTIMALQSGRGIVGHGRYFGQANHCHFPMRVNWKIASNDKKAELALCFSPDSEARQAHNPAVRDPRFKSWPRNQFKHPASSGGVLRPSSAFDKSTVDKPHSESSSPAVSHTPT